MKESLREYIRNHIKKKSSKNCQCIEAFPDEILDIEINYKPEFANMQVPLNRLNNLGCYLCGPIDFAEDLGRGWREDITDFLVARNATIFNPLEHPFHGVKTFDDVKRPYLKHLADTRQFDKLRDEIKAINKWDLRAIDLSSFVVVNYNMDIPMCGTHEELFMANRQNKPVLLIVKDKSKMPKWLYGRVPHEHMFEGIDALKEYLSSVDTDPDFDFCEADTKRWLFLEGPWMYTSIESYNNAKAKIDQVREESLNTPNPYFVEEPK